MASSARRPAIAFSIAFLAGGTASAQGGAAHAPGAAPNQTGADAPPPAATPAVALTTLEGRILGVEEESLVVDVGSRAGAKAGIVAELWRPLKLRNPATGRVVEDRYRIGSLRLTEALEVVSFAKPEGETRQPPKPGDIVVLRVEKAAPSAAPAAKAAMAEVQPAPVVAADPDSKAVGELIESLHGQGPDERARVMLEWADANPRNRFAGAVREEARLLLGPSMPGLVAQGRATPGAESAEPKVKHFVLPKGGLSGAPLELGIELEGGVRGAVLHVRHVREVAYVSIPMRPAGRHFWVATIPAEQVRAPHVEYFIEAVQLDGDPLAVVGTEYQPFAIDTPDAPKPSPALHHDSIVSVYTDYADYNRFRGNDRVWQTEGFFGMRFQDEGIRAVRTGFGVYRGRGGSVDELDVQKLDPRPVGLTYGYLEGEYGVNRTLSFIARLAVGLGEDGVKGGGQAHVRIGNDLETNLMVGGEVLGGIGLRGVAQLELAPRGTFPFLVRTEVTNQPAGERSNRAVSAGPVSGAVPRQAEQATELGGRVVLQGGYRIAKPLVVFARVSGEGRTINHAGLGFGGGVTVEW